MTTIKAYGQLLTASVADRVLTYRLLPYGEPGRTNVGKVTASRGHLTLLPPEQMVANLEHDPTRPVARFVALTEDDDQLTASVRVLRTTAGDDLLVEASEKVRTGISVEIDDPVIRAGHLVGGTLTGAGFVTTPAFPSAQLVAADAGDLPADEPVLPADAAAQVADALTTALEVIEDNTTTEGDQPDDQEEDTMGDTATATAPAGSLAARRTASPATISKGDLFARLAGAHKSGGERGLRAALADIVPGDILGMEQPQYVGELWSGKGYQRKIVPLFNHDTLTSFDVRGWRWVTKPAVAPYLGNKTAVPSNSPTTEQVIIGAERIAGAHDIDRKFRDFNDVGFFAAYFAAMTESYARVSDAQVLADVLAAATPVERGAVPAGVSAGMVSIADGALAILNETDTMPTFAVVATDLWREIFLTREEDKLAYLNAAMGLEDGTIGTFGLVPSAALVAGSVLVGTKAAVTVHELGGEAPIRVEAQNIANGGIDEGVFGYYAVNVHDATGLALVQNLVP